MAGDTLRSYRGNGDSPAALAALLRTSRMFLAGETAPVLAQNLAVAAGLALLALLVLARPFRRPALGLIALTTLVPLLATWVSSQSRPIFNERYLIAAVPGMYILLGAAIDGAAANGRTDSSRDRVRRWAAALALVLVMAVGLASLRSYYFDTTGSKAGGWRGLAAELTRVTRGFPAGAAWVVGNGPDPTLWYYYPAQAERWVVPPGPKDEAGAMRVVAELAERGVQRVAVPLSGDSGWDSGGIASTALASRYPLLTTASAGGWRVAVVEAIPANRQPLAAQFDAGLRLDAAGWQPESPQAGSLLGVHLLWSGTLDRVPAGAKVTVQLLDSAGALVVQSDGALRREPGWSSHALQLPDDLAPGAYRLIAAVYDPAAPGLPRLATAAGGDAVELGVLTVRE